MKVTASKRNPAVEKHYASMKLRKTTQGNYTGWHDGYYLYFFKRPHGGWACIVRKNWQIVSTNGYFGTSMKTIKTAKQWAKNTIKNGKFWITEITPLVIDYNFNPKVITLKKYG